MRILLGPILFMMDVAPVNVGWGIALTIVLLPAIGLVFWKRRVWAAIVSVAASLLWLFLGTIGEGIQA